jgi:hypothetical protein
MKNDYRSAVFSGSFALMVWSSVPELGADRNALKWRVRIGHKRLDNGRRSRRGQLTRLCPVRFVYAWLGGAPNEADYCYQLMTIPSLATSATLSFYYNIESKMVGLLRTTFSSSGFAPDDVYRNAASKGQSEQGPQPTVYHNATFDLLPYKANPLRFSSKAVKIIPL